jgi:hypothetical protein
MMEQEKKDAIVDMAATLAARAEEFDMVLILAQKKAGGAYSLDNDLTIENCVCLIEGNYIFDSLGR